MDQFPNPRLQRRQTRLTRLVHRSGFAALGTSSSSYGVHIGDSCPQYLPGSSIATNFLMGMGQRDTYFIVAVDGDLVEHEEEHLSALLRAQSV